MAGPSQLTNGGRNRDVSLGRLVNEIDCLDRLKWIVF